MYRQILIRPEDRCYQHVLWRDEPNEKLGEYELNTVTYGVSSSPYLAIRTLRQLAEDHGAEFPSRVSEVLVEETFMDDITTGCSTLDEAKQLKADVTSILSKGHFELRKWSTNEPSLLSDVPPEHCQIPKSFEESGKEFVKILGIRWNPSNDTFSYTSSDTFDVLFANRAILSRVARIFYPFGWIYIVIFVAKSLLKMYINNRVVQVTDLISPEHWYHVATEDDPADCCSRGVSCPELIDHPLWWNGPSLPPAELSSWPCKQTLLAREELPEVKPLATECSHIVQSENLPQTLTAKFSALTKLQNLLAWCLRFISNARTTKSNWTLTALTASELEKSMKTLVKFTHTQYMAPQVSQVESHQQCENSTQNLSPCLDKDGLLQVGGRFSKANPLPSTSRTLPYRGPRSRWKIIKIQIQNVWNSRHYTLHSLANNRMGFNLLKLKLTDQGIVNDPTLLPMPCNYKLTRGEQVHTGVYYNVVRVVTLRTENGEAMRRPIVKVSLLPI